MVPLGLGRNSMTFFVRFRGGVSLYVSGYLNLRVLLVAITCLVDLCILDL